MIMLLVNALLYLLIALYLEAVFSGHCNIPWNFLCTKSFWCNSNSVKNANIYYSGKPGRQAKFIEEEPINLNAGIQINALWKVFNDNHVAVRELNLNMYEDQITVLLGHKGAGKTTTISMLTGIFRPSSGTAKIAGHDICTDMSKARTSLGWCPQANILFDALTVREHLYFFGKLKGCKNLTIRKETRKYIQLLELGPVKHTQTRTLSSGMKRKLSVGIALCGNSKVVILDEPTVGLSPAARRVMWNLLQAEKKGRTILLTTHFMDEAELLGDRIAIMIGGALQCCGSTFFLKKKYGSGYLLRLEIAPDCNVEKITRLLSNFIPNIEVNTNVGSEVTYVLPEDHVYVFEKMFGDLEVNAKSRGIVNYGISTTTLEEVYMKVEASYIQEGERHNNVMNNTSGNFNILDYCNIPLKSIPLHRNQFKAMMMKKYYYTIRSYMLNFFLFAVPTIFIILGFCNTLIQLDDEMSLPALNITLDSYDHPITVMNGAGQYAAEYEKYIKQLGHTVNNLGTQLNVNDFLSDKKQLREIKRYIVGASFQKDHIIGWFNNIALHSMPLTLNLIHNAILHKQDGGKHNIHVINYPLPFSPESKVHNLKTASLVSSGSRLINHISFAMALVASLYIFFCIKERISKFKHLQFISGVNIFIFWFASYLFDFLHFAVICLFLTALITLVQVEGLSTFSEIGTVFLILILFGFAMLPITYFVSDYFTAPSTGFIVMTIIYIGSGCCTYLIVKMTMLSPKMDNVVKQLDFISVPNPHYNLIAALSNLDDLYTRHKMCKQIEEEHGSNLVLNFLCETKNKCCNKDIHYFTDEKHGIGRNLIWFLISGIVAFTLVIIQDCRFWHKMVLKFDEKVAPPPEEVEDDEVANKRHKVETATRAEINSYSLLLTDLSKYYREVLAVNRLSVGIEQSECFGLLGLNGAGKTTTIKMLTGDEDISYGNAWVNGFSLKSDMQKIYPDIGYCPQFDALLDNLTCREIMTIFFLIRGVPKFCIMYFCEKLATDFCFQDRIDRQVQTLSRRNKRKLSIAIAFMGNPRIVYLDEPTTDMDPIAKRAIWDRLCKVRESGTCLILTSQSMEECEALCDCIAIMVNGTFKCLGSTQHLKSKFMKGYTLTVKLKKTDEANDENARAGVRAIPRYIQQNFPNVVIGERFQDMLTYYISDTNVTLSSMFGLMENGRELLNIEEYSWSQSSLQEVFLNFATQQKEYSDSK